MTALATAQVVPSSSSSVDLTAPVRYLARQPILDMRGRVHGYELLYRSGLEPGFRGEANHATRTTIDDTVVFGVRRLTGGVPAFVNCTAGALLENLVEVLPPGMAVLEILENVEPTPELLAACQRLKRQGYRIALDDFAWRPELAPLTQLADYIKIDFRRDDAGVRGRTLSALQGFSGALLAEKVETRTEYDLARAQGFTLFQGYYFCQPMLMVRRKVPANHMVHMQLLQMLDDDPLDLKTATELVKRDASLTYRLIRLVNSAAVGMRQEISSIRGALLAIGDDLFRRIALLAIASESNAGQPAEIVRMAFVRARFCELGSTASRVDPMEEYLLGLFSMLPAMLQAPMGEAIADLPLRESLRRALLGETSAARDRLTWLEFHERGDWEMCDRLARERDLDSKKMLSDFTEAVVWADEIISAVA